MNTVLVDIPTCDLRAVTLLRSGLLLELLNPIALGKDSVLDLSASRPSSPGLLGVNDWYPREFESLFWDHASQWAGGEEFVVSNPHDCYTFMKHLFSKSTALALKALLLSAGKYQPLISGCLYLAQHPALERQPDGAGTDSPAFSFFAINGANVLDRFLSVCVFLCQDQVINIGKCCSHPRYWRKSVCCFGKMSRKGT